MKQIKNMSQVELAAFIQGKTCFSKIIIALQQVRAYLTCFVLIS